MSKKNTDIIEKYLHCNCCRERMNCENADKCNGFTRLETILNEKDNSILSYLKEVNPDDYTSCKEMLTAIKKDITKLLK